MKYREPDPASAELCSFMAVLVLGPIRWGGWLFTWFWPGMLAIGLGADRSGGFSPQTRHDFLVIGILWPFFFFGGVLPARRWLSSAAISCRLGQPLPPWSWVGTGSIAERTYEGLNRTIASVGDTGVLVHPSEDGINDLGQTGGLPKSVVNQFGYRQVHVNLATGSTRCRHCYTELFDAPERCRRCGVYLDASGCVNLEAQYRNTGSVELPALP